MAKFRVTNFERGFTDNYVNAAQNKAQKMENLLISRNRKPVQRPGSEIFESDPNADLIPPGNQKVQYIKNFEGTLFEFTGDEIYYRTSAPAFTELLGPVDSNDAFGGIGVVGTAKNSSAIWQNHLYATTFDYARPRKIYKDENDTFQIRTAGLPGPGDVQGFNSAVALANALKATYNAHVADLAEHVSADATVTSPNASTVETLINLTNELKDKYIAHNADAIAGSPTFHQAQSLPGNPLEESVDISLVSQAISVLNEIKAQYNAHDADATAHTTGGTHQEATADASTAFTVTPESADGASYIYAIVYKYEYFVGSVRYLDRSKPEEVLVSNAGDFSTAANGNDLSGIPTITNATFGTAEAWDTSSITVEIYRTTNGGTVLKKVGEVANGTATFEDDTADADLGINIYTSGGVLANEEPPPCKFVVNTNDMNWYCNVKEGSEIKGFRIRHTLQLDPDSSPSTFTVDLDDEITGAGKVGINPIVFTADKVYRLEGVVDALGRGFIKKRVIDDTVGCISHNSIVNVKNGLYFAAIDGFYFTNGFKTTKISSHLNTSYNSVVATTASQERIFGVHDPDSELVYWALTEDSTDTENESIWVHDPLWGVPNNEGTFTKWLFNNNGQPTALEVIDGQLIRADAQGYVFKHSSELFTDPVIDTSNNPEDWNEKAVVYNYVSPAFSFGTELGRKWVTKLMTVLKSTTNISLQPGSINDDTGATKELKEIRSRKIFTWGDPFFTWGDPEFIWNAAATGTFVRRFPKNSLRCTLKQVRYTNSRTVLLNSDLLGDVTVDSGALTVTLASGTFPSTVTLPGAEVIFSNNKDDVVNFDIVSNTSTVLTVSDPFGQLSAFDGTQSTWLVVGIRLGEQFHLEGYEIDLEPFGESPTYFRAGDDGSNA